MICIGDFHNANHLFLGETTVQGELSGVVWWNVLAWHTCRRIAAQVVVPFHQSEEVDMGEGCSEKKTPRLFLMQQDAPYDVDVPVVEVLEWNALATDELNTVEEIVGKACVSFLSS